MSAFIRNLLITQPTQNTQATNEPSFSYRKYIQSAIPLIGGINEDQKKETEALIKFLRSSDGNFTAQNKLELSRLLQNYHLNHNSTIGSQTRTLIKSLLSSLASNKINDAKDLSLSLEKELSLLNYDWASYSKIVERDLTHPALKEIKDVLHSISHNPSQSNLTQLVEKLNHFLEKKVATCYKKPLLICEEKSLRDLIKKLEDASTLSPFLLPYLFATDSNTSYFPLLKEASTIITAQIESQSKWALSRNPATLLASAFQNVSTSNSSSRAPFKALFAAIKLEQKEYKLDLLKNILKSCYLAYPEFEAFIKDMIRAWDPTADSVEQWIENNKDDKEKLPGVILAAGSGLALSKGCQYRDQSSEEAVIEDTCAFLEKQISNQGSKQPSNFIVEGFNEVLSVLKLGSIPTSYAQFLSSSLISILDSAFINKWMDKQSDKGKELFLRIKTDLKRSLDAASSVKDYENAISQFLENYNKQIITLSGFELPEFLDNEEIESRNEKVEKIDKTVENIRVALDSSKANNQAGFDWSNQALAKEKVKKEKKKLCKNLKDQLTHQLISNLTGISAQTFFNIKTLEASSLDRDKQKVFASELKKEINSSKCNWFLKKTIIFLLPILYKIIGKYTNSLVDHVIDDVNDRVETINKEVLFQRTSNCLSKYNSLLKSWAETKEGGEKNKVIGSLMKEKGFLEFGKEESYSQDQLYKTVSDKFVANYFDLYKDSENDLTISSKIYSFAKQPILKNRTTFPRKTINFIGVSLKYLFIGLPAILINSPLICFEKLSNTLVKSVLKRFLASNKVIDSIVESSKQNVFESNPYVYPITSFFAEQLESISKSLSKTPENSSSDPMGDDKNIISDKTHSQLKTLFELLFEVLNKNKFNTQEQLQHYLKDPSLRKQSQQLIDSNIIPAILDSIINTSIMASETLLKKDQLQQPLSLLLEELNEIVLTPNPNNQERLAVQRLKNQNAQEKLNKYSKKVLNQIIDHAIDSVFEDQAETDEVKAKKFIQNFKDAFINDDGIINKGKQLLNEITTPEDLKVKTSLTDFREIINRLTIKLEHQQDSIRKRDSRISKEVKLKLEKVAPLFEKLITDKQSNSGLIELQATQMNILTISQDLPLFTHLQRSLEKMKQYMTEIPNDQSEELVGSFTTTTKYLNRFFSEFDSNELRLVKEEPLYQNLKDLMKQQLSSRKELSANITNKSVKRLNLLEKLQNSDVFEDIKNKKKSELDDKSLLRFFNFKRQRPSDVAKDLRKIANNLESKADKEVVESCLNAVLSAKSVEKLNQAVKIFQDKISLLIKEEKEKLAKYSIEVSKIDDTFLQCCIKITSKFTNDLNSEKEAYNNQLAEFQKTLNDLELAVSDQNLTEDLNVIHTKVTPPKILKASIHQFLYHQIYPKAEGLLNLIRDGNFAQFLVNHTVLMPFAKN